MTLIPWEYIKKNLFLSEKNPVEIEKNLNYKGLEAKMVEKQNQLYFEFSPFPNRPDLLSWWGIVQEIGILLNCPLHFIDFPSLSENHSNLIKVKIETDNCQEFHLGFVREVEIKVSPAWIREYLATNNIRSINNLVDIANLVMLETGQPLHVFDYETLPEKQTIEVRQISQNIFFNTLQNQELVLNSKDMVISSGGEIISLAGIIGGQKTALTSSTKNVLIECASFNPQTIKKTANRLNISTLASRYFSRQTNLIFSPRQVLQRVISLIIESYQGDLKNGAIFTYQEVKKIPLIITIDQEFITKKIGQKFTSSLLENIWQQLKFTYQKVGETYHITVPFYRPDITQAEDLLEEILRIYDYNKVNNLSPQF